MTPVLLLWSSTIRIILFGLAIPIIVKSSCYRKRWMKRYETLSWVKWQRMVSSPKPWAVIMELSRWVWKDDGDSKLNSSFSSRQRKERAPYLNHWFVWWPLANLFSLSQLVKTDTAPGQPLQAWEKWFSQYKAPGNHGQIPKCHISVCPDAPGALGAVWWEAEQAAPPQPDVVVAGVD